MKVFAVLCAVCLATALGGETEEYDSENAGNSGKQQATPASPSYTPAKYQPQQYVLPSKAAAYTPPQQLTYLTQPAYKYVPQSAQAPVSYVPTQPQVHQQQHQQQQQQPHQFGFVQQNGYSAPNFAKISSAPQKISFAPIHPQAPTPVPYSLATDVSSFKYSSPLVSYSNLGLLSQINGKGAGSQSRQQQPAQQHTASQQLSVTSPQQFVYRPKTQQPQQIPYQQVPNQQVSPKYIYSQVPQLAYTPQQSQTQSIYPASTQKLSPSLPPFLYSSAQPSYTPVQLQQQQQQQQQPPHQQAHSAQPVQTAHSVPQPLFSAAPRYHPYDIVYSQSQAFDFNCGANPIHTTPLYILTYGSNPTYTTRVVKG